MSSLNPFAARREKKEKKAAEQMAQYDVSHGDQAQFIGEQQQFEQSAPRVRAEASYETEDFDKYLPSGANEGRAQPNFPERETYEPPSRARQCFGKLQSGFMIGAALGGAIGFLYGTYAAIKYKHVLYLPIAVVQAGGGFGFFLACGTVIRCEEPGIEALQFRPSAERARLLQKDSFAGRGPAEARIAAAAPSARARCAIVAVVCD